MKTKHLHKNLISSMYAMLISLIFFLLPLSTKAQKSPDCTASPGNMPCCVASSYWDKVSDCFNGGIVIDNTGAVTGSGGSSNYQKVASIDSTRVSITIREHDDGTVELRTYLIGPLSGFMGLELYFLYDRTILEITNSSGTVLPLPTDRNDNKFLGPTAFNPSYMSYNPIFTNTPSPHPEYGIIGTSKYCYYTELDNAKYIYIYNMFNINVPTGNITNYQGMYMEPKETLHLYTIHFKKVNPAIPLTSKDVGYVANVKEAVASQGPSISGGYTPKGGVHASGDYGIYMVPQPTSSIAYSWVSIPGMFEYRYPSSVKTDEQLMVNSKKADIYGIFKQGSLPSSTDLPVSIKKVPGGVCSSCPLTQFDIADTIAVANWDGMPDYYGFIYTSKDASLYYTPGQEPTVVFDYKNPVTGEFQTKFDLTVNGATQTINLADLLASGSVIVGGETFNIVLINSTTGSAVGYETVANSATGDYKAKIDVVNGDSCSYWTFSVNTHEGITSQFLNLGAKQVFYGPGDCFQKDPVLVLDGDVCDPTYSLKVADTIVAFYTIATSPGGSFHTTYGPLVYIAYKWYFDDGMGGGEIAIDTTIAPTLNITSYGPGKYRVVAIATTNHHNPFVPYCESTGGNSYAPFDVDPCMIILNITQTVSSPVCNGDPNVIVHIEIENTSLTIDGNANVNFDCDIPGLSYSGANIIAGGGTWTAPNLWNTDLLAGSTNIIELTYTAVNTGTTVAEYKHILTIDSILLNPVTNPKMRFAGLADTAYIEVLPTPVADNPGIIEFCNGDVAQINITGTFTEFDYTVIGAPIGLTGNTNVTQIPVFTAVNMTDKPIVDTIKVLPHYTYVSAAGITLTCDGLEIEFPVTVFPTPTTVVPLATYCHGDEVEINFVNLNDTTTGIVYRWNRVVGFYFGLSATSGEDIIKFTAENTGILPLVALYEVTPYYIGATGIECVGVTENFLITVNPKPDVSTILDQTYCQGENVLPYVFTGNTPDATYYWKQTSATLMPELAASGYDILPAFTANTTGTFNFKVYASYDFANESCIDSTTFSIKVNRGATLLAINNKAYCANNNTGTIPLAPFALPFGAKVEWEVMSGGDNIGMAQLFGTDSIEHFTALNATSVVLSTVIKATPVYDGCAGEPGYFVISVMPEMTVDLMTDIVVCNNTHIDDIYFNGPAIGASYYWTATNAAAINMAPNGHGFIPAFTAKNSTGSIITSVVTVYAYMEIDTYRCQSVTRTFNISVAPEEVTVDPMDDIIVCSGTPFTDIPFGGTATDFYWEATSNGTTIGMTALNGTDTIFYGFTPVNTTTAPIVVEIKVTPIYNNSGFHCYGDPIFFNIIVDPIPTAEQVSDIEVCGGTVIGEIEISGLVPGTVFEWFSNTDLGFGIHGTGNIPSFTSVNTTLVPIVATITVTPKFFGSQDISQPCVGTDMEFLITINPSASLFAIDNKAYCNGENTGTIFLFAQPILGAKVEWEVISGGDNIGMMNLSGVDSIESFAATNPSNVLYSTVIKATPVYAGCAGEPEYFVISVMPTIPTANPVAPITVCNNTAIPSIYFSNPVTGASYSWTATANATDIGMATSGNGFVQGFTAYNHTSGVIDVTVTVNSYMEVGYKTCSNVTPPMTFTISVAPEEVTVDPMDDIIVCSGTPFTDIPFGGTATDFYWEATSNGTTIGMTALNGTDTIFYGFTPVNTTTAPIVVEIKVTPIYNNSGFHCYGDPIYFNIIVDPIPTADQVADIEVCAGTTIGNIVFSGIVPGTIFNWTSDNSDIGLGYYGAGNIPSFVATNPTDSVIVANITVTPIFFGSQDVSAPCVGTDMNFTITVSPMPAINPVSNITVCKGADVKVVFASNMLKNVIYNWYVDNTSNAAAIGMGTLTSPSDSIVFVATNSTANPITVWVTVTPSSVNGATVLCTGDSFTFSITVSPEPTMLTVADQIVCVGEMTAEVNFSALNAPVGTIFTWTNNKPTIGLAANGIGNILPFTVLVADTAKIKVSAAFPSGSAVCLSDSIEFVIIGVESPIMNPITDITVCAGDTVRVPAFGSIPAGSYTWRHVIGDSIGLVPLAGTGNIVPFVGVNNGNTVLSALYAVKVSGGASCGGHEMFFTITVNPIPNVEQIADQTLCAGERTNDIIFTGNTSGTIYRWTNSQPDVIGLAGSGTGNILAFNTTNATDTSIVATIAVVPEFMDGTPASACKGDTMFFNITVHPMPVMNPISNITVCDGADVNIGFTSSMLNNVKYTWIVDDISNAIAIGLQGTSDSIKFVAENNTANPITVLVTVTPSSVSGKTVLCTGDSFTFSITVSPEPAMLGVADQEICVGEMTAEVDFSALNAPVGTIFTWTNNKPTIGLAASGTGNIPPFKVLVADTARMKVSAQFPSGSAVCLSDSMEFVIIGVEPPVMNPIEYVTTCSSATPETIIFGASVPGVTYDWHYVGGHNFAATLTGTGSNFTYTPINDTETPLWCIYAVKAINGVCESKEIYFVITVNPIPEMLPVTSQVRCTGDYTAEIDFSALHAPEGTIFYWTNSQPAIGLAASGTGNIPPFKVQIPDTAIISVTAYYPDGTVTCMGDTIEFTIIGLEIPIMTPIENIIVCNGDKVYVPVFESTVEQTTWKWRLVDGVYIGLDEVEGIGQFHHQYFYAVNNGSTVLSATWGVTPNSGYDCDGPEVFFTITVNPTPVASDVADKVYCHGAQVDAYDFTGTVAGTNYYWVQSNWNEEPQTMLPKEGYNTLPAFTAVNLNTNYLPIVLEYEVYPSFENLGVACEGEMITFSITIYPKPTVTPIADKIFCKGQPTGDIWFDGTGFEYQWMQISGDVITNSIDLFEGDVSDFIPSFVTINAGNTTLEAVIQVTPLREDPVCSGDPIQFTISVKPTPNVEQVANQTLCAGERTNDIIFTGNTTGTIYRWTNSQPDVIGLAGSGTGNILAFNTINNTDAPIVATIAVVPEFMNGAPADACKGDTMFFTITVNPMPVMNHISNITVCDGYAVNIPFTSTMNANVEYDWTVDNTLYAAAIGMGTLTSPSNNLIFTAVNTTDNPITVTVIVTPRSVNPIGGATLCVGEPITFTITVSPEPILFEIADQIVCVGEMTAPINFGAFNAPAGTIFYWENDDPTIGLPGSGTGNIPSFEVTAGVQATITVIAQFPNGSKPCISADSLTFTITGYYRPVMTPIENIAVCAGETVIVPAFASTPTAVTYKWRLVDGDYIGNALLYGNDSIPQFVAVNSGDALLSATYGVRANGGAHCDGPEIFFTIIVSPKPILFEIADQIICVGEMTAPINFGAFNAPAGTIFYWENDNPSIGLPGLGTGDIPSFEVTADVTATITVIAQFPNGSKPCISADSITFTITGYYRPVMTPIMNITVCAGSEIIIPDFESTAINPVYDWRFVDGSNIGLNTLFGQGNMPSFEAVNNGTTPLMALYAVRASEAGYCEGEEIFFVIQVNPIPVIAPVGDPIIYCHGTQVPALVFTGNTINTTYHWLQTNYAIENIPELPQEGYNILPAFYANNWGTTPITLEYEVIPTFESNGVPCSGEPITFTIIIEPKPEVNPMPDLSFCAGDLVGDIMVTGPADEYRWVQISGDVITDIYTDLFAGGTITTGGTGFGYIPGFTVVNAGNTALVAVMRVTPVTLWPDGGFCEGDAIEFTIKVKPTPNVFQVEDRIFCTGVWTPAIVFEGYTEGTIFHWENDKPEIGLVPSGTGNLPSFFTNNPTNEAIVATIVVIPEFKGDPYDACIGDSMIFTITIDPIPEVTPTPDLIYCVAAEVDTIFFTGTVVDAEYRWKQIAGTAIPITTDIDLWAGGINLIPAFTTSNTGVDILYAVIEVTPWTADGLCYGDPIQFTIAVAPIPVVDEPQPNKVDLCAGETFDGYSFTGIATSYVWTMETTPPNMNIGLAPSGVNQVLPFLAINNTTIPITATITVIPVIYQAADTCTGEPKTMTITVSPVPVMNPVSNKNYCSITTVEEIPFTSSMNENVVYAWYPDNNINATSIGLDITATPTPTGISFVPTNNTDNVITVLITVIPWSVDPDTNEALCEGAPITFTITVSPNPDVQPVADQTVCVGDWTTPINFGALHAPAGTIFHWTLNGDYIGLPTSGTGNISSYQITAAGTVTITVEAVYPNGGQSCSGASATFTITTYERPVMTPIADITLCAPDVICGAQITTQPPAFIVVPDFESTFAGATYTWHYVSGDNIGCIYVWEPDPSDPSKGCWVCSGDYLPLSGTGNFPTGYGVVNTGIAPASATYAVKANGGAHCDGEEIFFTITVNPTPHLDPIANQPYCANTTVAEFPFSGTVPGTTFTWTRINMGMYPDYIGNLPPSGTGSMPSFTTVDNTTDHILMAQYQVAASYTYNGITCGSEAQEFFIKVLPNATTTNLENKVYCNKDWVEIPMFEGVATVWRWTQTAGQNIGLDQNYGEGQFPSFFAKNDGDTPIAATYMVIPYYEAEGISCPGVPGFFTIVVNPQPRLDSVPKEMVYCAGEHAPQYVFTGTYGSVYHWERIGGDPIGNPDPMSGTGPFPGFYTVNETNDLLTANFKVWNEYKNSDGTICKSDEQLFSVSVLPKATIDINAIPHVFCHNESVPAIHFPTNIPGSSVLNIRYEWIRTGGDYIGTAESGMNTIPAFIALNPGSTPRIAEYKVTAMIEYNGIICGSQNVYPFVLTVNPKAVLDSPNDAGVVCSESNFYYEAKTKVEGITFTWVRPAKPYINGGVAGSGTGPIINEKLINTSTDPIVVEYHFTMSGYCTDPNEIFVVKVLVTPTPTMVSPADAGSICSGDWFEYIINGNDPNMVYAWKRNADPAVNGGAGASGVGASIKELLNNTSNGEVVVEYVVTINYEGCETHARDYIVSVILYQKTQIVRDLPDTPLCIGNDLVLTVDAIGCNDMEYVWYHNGTKVATTNTGVYIIPDAKSSDAGTYYVEVTGCCETAKTATSRIATVVDKTILQKWDDVLYVDNSKDLYHTYQWYKVIDGVKHPIDGATKQYHSETPLSGTYMVEMFNALGEKIDESCPFTPNMAGTPGNISIYPNPVSQGGTLTIIMDMTSDQVSGSIIEIYDMVGKQIRTKVVDGKTTSVTMQHIVPGSYVVRITSASGETMKSEKVIVR